MALKRPVLTRGYNVLLTATKRLLTATKWLLTATNWLLKGANSFDISRETL